MGLRNRTAQGLRDQRCAPKIVRVNDQHSHEESASPDLQSRVRDTDAALAAARQLAASLPMERSMVFFDLEATGLDVTTDRIVEISCVRVEPDGSARVFDTLVNPVVEISAEVTEVHGIANDHVAQAPTFERIAADVEAFLDGADLAGYNHGRYDLPLLEHEFTRVGIDFAWRERRLIDVSVIFRRMEPRSLAGAMRFYCGEDLQEAHMAVADVTASMAVFAGQLERYAELSRDIDVLDAFTRPRGADAK